MKTLTYSIAIAIVALTIAPSVAVGQVAYSTGTQGCCDLLDPYYTLTAAPPGVPLGNLYSTTTFGGWVPALPGSWWIDSCGELCDLPSGNYTYQQIFTLAETTGTMLTGEFAADDSACVTLNGGLRQCTPGGQDGYEQYTTFEFATGFQVGTNTLEFVVNNQPEYSALEVAVSIENKLHHFGSGRDGAGPRAGLIIDAAGNLYGTTYAGGDQSAGTVFELTPAEGGGWAEKVLHNFGAGTVGANPLYAGVIFGADGNLYGTTSAGGAYGHGTVFKLTPGAGGSWTKNIIHNFNGTDGAEPYAGLAVDADGNLYGTTYSGGVYGGGLVFELSPSSGGGWAYYKLHNFGNRTDGVNPEASLIFDGTGNLYGTTYAGGTHNGGIVFELIPDGGGTWTYTKLHNFDNGREGANPEAGLVLDANGNLYGTTYAGGTENAGTVFELTPAEGWAWTYTKLHNFGQGTDGIKPRAGLIFDGAGNLYGTTANGGVNGSGTVFKLTPLAGGGWMKNIVHNFTAGTDGTGSYAGLVSDVAGNFYGTTHGGGNYSGGIVFQIMH